MGKFCALFVIGFVVAGGFAARAEDGVTISDGPEELDLVPLRDPRVTASSRIKAQVVADSPADDSDELLPSQPLLAPRATPQSTSQEESLIAPGQYPTSTEMVPVLPIVPRLIESTWYTRFEYMNWSGNGQTIDKGALYTLGYQRRVGRERFRAELFGTQIPMTVGVFSADNRYATQVDYLGGRTEYDLLFQPAGTSRAIFFVGVGSRFWLRDQNQILAGRQLIPDYQHTWLTFYPYVGMESRRDGRRKVEIYSRGRVGLLAITYEHLTLPNRTVFPGPGVTGQAEWGIRGDRFHLAGYFESFSFPGASDGLGGILPSYTLLTVGLKTGYTF